MTTRQTTRTRKRKISNRLLNPEPFDCHVADLVPDLLVSGHQLLLNKRDKGSLSCPRHEHPDFGLERLMSRN